MRLYRIKNWNENYENNRTRELKKMAWVPIPNSHDGDGYTSLVCRKDGPELFGAWVVILQVASRCGSTAAGCDARGTLLRDNGKPHDAESISRMTRFPVALIEKALTLLCHPDVGWMESEETEAVTTAPQEGAEIPHDGAEKSHPSDEERKNGRNGTEGNGTRASAAGVAAKKPTDGFDEFWTAYPKKVAKPDAQRAWTKQKCAEITEAIIAAVKKAVQSFDWKKEAGQFIPHPATWLNQRRWEDEVRPSAPRTCPIPEHEQPKIWDPMTA